MDDMSAWLAVLLVGIIVAAAVGIVPLRRYQDCKWAEHLAEQRRREDLRGWIVTSPQMANLAATFSTLQLTLRDSFTPAMKKAGAAAAELCKALDALPRPTWRQRVAMRIRGWFV